MSNTSSSPNDVPVSTLRAIKAAGDRITAGAESNAPQNEAAAPAVDPVTQARLLRSYHHAVDLIENETAKSSPQVLVAVQDRAASLLQSRLARDGNQGQPLQAGGFEAKFGEGPGGGDVWGWFMSWFDHVNRADAHPMLRPPDSNVASFADNARVAMVSDWGTNLYGAPHSAGSIAATGPYDLLLHLGDIYYSGTIEEAKARFVDVWPKAAGNLNRALNGNHEMYSGGFAYFDEIFKAFKQPSSYFALQNAHWLLLCVDTAYVDHNIDARQAAWLNAVVDNAGARKIVMFSHHQLFSSIGSQGPNLATALARLLSRKAITAWYWGHEHECIIYDRHAGSGLHARCIGNGGIPSPRKPQVTSAPTERTIAAVQWKRLGAAGDSPSSLVLDGSNPYIKGEQDRFGPHGYATLEFNGPILTESVFLPDKTRIYQNQIS
jgi:hypothetical protein